MTEQDEVARRIVKLLDESAENIGRAQRERLSAARQAALARHRAVPVAAWAPVWAGTISRFTEHRAFGVRYLIPIAALVLGLASVVYVHSNGTSSDIADIDAGLLTDELPINAYLDKGFDSWLKRSPR
jgi:Protein of unknown function (DUF3619)